METIKASSSSTDGQIKDRLRNIVKDILVRHAPEERKHEPHDFDYYLRCAKRALNLRDFKAAKRISFMNANSDNVAGTDDLRIEWLQGLIRDYGIAVRLRRGSSQYEQPSGRDHAADTA